VVENIHLEGVGAEMKRIAPAGYGSLDLESSMWCFDEGDRSRIMGLRLGFRPGRPND
jgi:hypothetical protein